MRYGLTIPLLDAPLHAQREMWEQVVDAGYTDLWSAEASGADAFSPLALAATWAPQARLGTAIVPAFTRGPALLAMQAATLADTAPGRFQFGIGASSPAIVERWNAIPFVEPYKRTRDVLRFLRAALAGEKVSADFDTFSVAGFRLDRAPEQPPPVLLAALRPGMLRLAGREGDGAIINWLSADDVATVVPHVGPGKEVVARIFVCPSEDADTVRAIGKRMIAAYLSVPVYAAFHEWLGRGEMLRPMWDHWASGDRKAAVEAIPDELVDALLVHGTPAQCRATIDRYVSNGVTVPVLAPVPVGMSALDAALAVAPTLG